MDFWVRQADARRRSRWLVALFLVAVATIVVAVNAVVLTLFALFDSGSFADEAWLARHPLAVIVTTLAVIGTVAIGSLYRTMSLAGGGGVVARALGGQRVPTDTRDPLRKRLLNIVEEMAIASGVPVPAVYVLEQEEGINAFAAGHTPANAAIAVTRGALTQLGRAELSGVIGHEFSHILNGDMRLNMRLMGLTFGLLVIALAGRTVAANAPRGRGRRGAGVGYLVIVGTLVMALGYVGVFFGRLIQAAVSRQRELLADAAAVQFTRDPLALRDALVKIGSVRGSRLRHPGAEEVSHMLFAPGATHWFATHPPLAARIRALDPSFDPQRLRDLKLEVRPQPLGVVQVVAKERVPRSFSDSTLLPLDPAGLPGLVGNPGATALARARELRESLSADLAAAGGHGARAAALLFALALDPAPDVRARQLVKLRATMGDALGQRVEAEAARLSGLGPEQRLPLLEEIVTPLRGLPHRSRERMLECLAELARVDGEIAIFEYALGALARVYLRETLEPLREARRARLRDVAVELQTVFSTLAAHGHGSGTARAQAYAQGMAHVGGTPLPFRPVPGWARALDRALVCLDGLAPADKARIVEGLAAVVVHDGAVTLAESELLRAICAAIHCPLPPLGGGVLAADRHPGPVAGEPAHSQA